MAFGVINLPQLRTAYPLDLSAINSALDDIKADNEKNRLLAERKAVGESLVPQQSTNNGVSAYQAPQNAMLASPAQGSAAAAGRDYAPGGDMGRYGGAIVSIESSGFKNPYQAVGPTVQSGDRAYGRFQVMGANVGPWTQEILGRRMSPQEFLASPEAQEAVFKGKFGQYVQKTGSPEAAASMWFTGRPSAPNARARDAQGRPLGITGQEYVNKFAANLGGSRSDAAPVQAAATAAPSSSGVNYRAAAATAFRQGNVELGISLLKQQQAESDMAYERSRQATQDAMTAETHGLTTEQARNALHDRAIKLIGNIANTIAAEPDAGKRSAMFQRFVSAHPDIAPDLRDMGVDPNDADAGIKFIIARARGMDVGETFGTPVYTTDANGKPQLGVLTKQGTYKAVQTPGAVLPPVKTIDQGTQTAIIGPGGVQAQPAMPKDLAGAARQTAVGKGQGEAIVNLPTVENNVKQALQILDDVVNDPYLPQMTGPVDARMPNVSGDAARVQSKIDQLKGQAFLQAFESIKGAGAITEVEGAKAEQAKSRLQELRVGDKDYPKALQDFRTAIIDLYEVAKRKASGNFTSLGEAPGNAQPPIQGARQAPDGHWYVQQNGQYFRVDQ